MIVDNTDAFIYAADITAKDVDVFAKNSTWSVAAAGAGVMSTAYKDKDAGALGGLAGAGSFAGIIYVAATDAFIESSTLTVMGDVDVVATSTSVLISVGASVAKASSARAEGEAERFEAVLTEYAKSDASKDVTRQRLYLEAMEEILPGISKIIVSPEAESVLILGGVVSVRRWIPDVFDRCAS